MEGPPIQPGYAPYPRDYGGGPIGPPPCRVRFDAIADAWRLLTQDWATWACMSLMMIAANLVITLPSIIYRIATTDYSRPRPNPYATGSWDSIGVTIVTTCVSQVVIGVFAAGLMFAGLKKIRTGQVNFGDMFGVKARLSQLVLAELVLCPVGILLVVASVALSPMPQSSQDPLVFPWQAFGWQILIGLVVALVYAWFTFVPLLILDRGMSFGDAYKTSIQTVGSKVFALFGVVLLVSFLSGFGVCACLVGILFTLPFPYICKAVIYNDFFRPEPQAETLLPDYGVSYPVIDPGRANTDEPPAL